MVQQSQKTNPHNSSDQIAEHKANSRDESNFGRPIALWLIALVPTVCAIYFTRGESDLAPLAITADRPGLIFSEYLLDYGPDAVEPQPILTPTILLRNVTDQPISVDELTASCGCVKPRLSQMTIPPQGEERITIPIRTAGEQPGLREYSVTVAYSDSKPRETTLTVRVVLPEPQVVVEPRVLGIVGDSGRAIEHSVTISDYRPDPLIVKSASSSSSLVGAKLLNRTVTDDGSRALVGVSVASDTPPGVHRAIIQFATDDPENSHLQVPVILQGAPRSADQQVVVRPPQLRLPGDQLSVDPVLLRISIPAAWKVSHINAFPPELNVPFRESAATANGDKEIHVRVSLSSIPPGQPQDGVITLIAEEGSQMVSIPVSFVWRPSL